MALKEQLPTIPAGSRGPLQIGDEQYLWALVVLEVLALFAMRSVFRRQHGG
jgi:hypothetical protein